MWFNPEVGKHVSLINQFKATWNAVEVHLEKVEYYFKLFYYEVVQCCADNPVIRV